MKAIKYIERNENKEFFQVLDKYLEIVSYFNNIKNNILEKTIDEHIKDFNMFIKEKKEEFNEYVYDTMFYWIIDNYEDVNCMQNIFNKLIVYINENYLNLLQNTSELTLSSKTSVSVMTNIDIDFNQSFNYIFDNIEYSNESYNHMNTSNVFLKLRVNNQYKFIKNIKSINNKNKYIVEVYEYTMSDIFMITVGLKSSKKYI